MKTLVATLLMAASLAPSLANASSGPVRPDPTPKPGCPTFGAGPVCLDYPLAPVVILLAEVQGFLGTL